MFLLVNWFRNRCYLDQTSNFIHQLAWHLSGTILERLLNSLETLKA